MMRYTHGFWTALLATALILFGLCEVAGYVDWIKGWP